MTEKYWRINLEDEYIDTWVEGEEVVAMDTRHELSVVGDTEDEAIDRLQEAVREYAVWKYIQKNQPTTVAEIDEGVDIRGRHLTEALHSLFRRGEIYEPDGIETTQEPH